MIHRWHPKHQYNVVRIKSLEPGYYDPDIRMLHACFDMYVEWFRYNTIEAELMNKESIDGNNPGMWDEMMELYKWWTVEKPERDRAEFITWESNEEHEEKEDEMLIRLMKIRRHIWYL